MSLESNRVFTWAALAAVGFIAGLTPQAHAQDQLWVRQFGTPVWEMVHDLAPDGAGGVFVVGATEGSLGGPIAGRWDAYLARYDVAGNRLWIRQFGTPVEDIAYALVPDVAGGVFVAGITRGSLGGPNAGGDDAFLARYDSEGSRIWIRQLGTSRFERGTALAIDGAGGVLIAGSTSGSLGGPNAGSEDAYLARYDGAGKQLWIRQFGSAGRDIANTLSPDGTGGAMIAGHTNWNLGGPFLGSYDAFLARYDGAGNQRWIRQFGTIRRDRASALAPDGVGGVVVTGWTYGDLGGPNAGLAWEDAFLARYDSRGNRLWLRQFGTIDSDRPKALVPDGAGGVLLTGWTGDNLGGPNAGLGDAFLARYDSAGNQRWIRQFGTAEWDVSDAIARDGAGGIMVAGYTDGSLGGPNAGERDAFLARYTDGFCYADCDQSNGVGVLDLFDFLCFQDSFVTGEAYACDCDTSTGPLVCDLFDFLCFQDAFVGGCN